MALPPDHVMAAIEEGQRLKGWIANGYAQVEYLLGEIIARANEMPAYEVIHARLPHRPEKRIAKVKQILQIEGFFSAYGDEIKWLVEAFEFHQPTRHLLLHRFCTAYHTPDGDFGLQFRKWHRDGDADTEIKKIFRLIDLEYERAQFTHAADRALALVQEVHHQLGLVDQ